MPVIIKCKCGLAWPDGTRRCDGCGNPMRVAPPQQAAMQPQPAAPREDTWTTVIEMASRITGRPRRDLQNELERLVMQWHEALRADVSKPRPLGWGDINVGTWAKPITLDFVNAPILRGTTPKKP